MDRTSPQKPAERYSDHASHAPASANFQSSFPPSAAQPPPLHFPFADPFHSNRDPFLTRAHGRSDSLGPASARAWPASSQGHSMPNGQSQHTPPPHHSHPLPPPPPTNGLGQMSLPYDPSRQRSPGASGSPPQHSQAPPHESLPPPPPFQSRHMLPPSPPQLPSAASSLPGSAPRGPPTASPFTGARDLATYSSNRPAGGMSISSILGGNEERKGHGSPLSSTPKSMPPPSPGRARSSSMREGYGRSITDVSPPRALNAEPRPSSAALGHERVPPEQRREGIFPSPHFRSESLNNFRTFQPAGQDLRSDVNGHGPPGRPSSQPAEPLPPHRDGEMMRRDPSDGGRFGAFRSFGEPYAPPTRSEATTRQEPGQYSNGHGSGHPIPEHGTYNSPHSQHERPPLGLSHFQAGAFGAPAREEQPALFRPAYHPTSEPARDLAESHAFRDNRHGIPRSSPPLSDFPPFDRHRGGFSDRPITLEEHHRIEAMQREQQRKESDSSLHRAVFNISPEINRKGRNSPLPQAVQGAQPRHVGPGGDNPSLKMEFGRMFSGLGSGVGTATPTGTHANGATTPSRLTPMRHVEGGDLVRTAVAEIEEGRRSTKSDGRKKNGRRAREDEERINGRETPDHQRGTKRAKTNNSTHHHHHHHVHPHHHHHHQPPETMPNPFNTIRFQSNPPSHTSVPANPPALHHHHHHGSHAHPGHHHHHAPRAVPPARKPTTTVMSRRLVEDCAKKPRKHLGSQLYTTEIDMPPLADIYINAKVQFNSKMKPIPFFEGKENCTYTIRVPREYLAYGGDVDDKSNYFEGICNLRQLWGTDVYTDDSDVVAAAVHAGWLKGDFGEMINDDLRDVCGNESEQDDNTNGTDDDPTATSLAIRPRKPVRCPPTHDAHITILILPPLERYASTVQHHIWSREWSTLHDGMSFMIHRVDFVNETPETRCLARGAKARKDRIAVEEAKRREAAAGLLMFASGDGGAVRVGA